MSWLIGAISTLATVVTVLLGLKGRRSGSKHGRAFLAGVLIVSITVLVARGPSLGVPPAAAKPVVRTWPLAGLTYISYNLMMSVPVLASLGTTLRSRKEVAASALVGSLGLGTALVLVYLAVVSSFPGVLVYEVPMAGMASEAHRLGGRFYTLIFLTEVYTTASQSVRFRGKNGSSRFRQLQGSSHPGRECITVGRLCGLHKPGQNGVSCGRLGGIDISSRASSVRTERAP